MFASSSMQDSGLNLLEASVRIIQSEVGRDAGPQVVTLDQFWFTSGTKAKTLIKIDVEGAELLDVIAGGLSWLKPEQLLPD